MCTRAFPSAVHPIPRETEARRQSDSPVTTRGAPRRVETKTTVPLSHGYVHSASSVCRSGETQTRPHIASIADGFSGPVTSLQPEPVRRSMVGFGWFASGPQQVRKTRAARPRPARSHVRPELSRTWSVVGAAVVTGGDFEAPAAPQPPATHAITSQLHQRTGRALHGRVTAP